MSSFPYEREGGPKLLDSAGLLEAMYALRLHDARWLIMPRFLIVASPAAGADWSTTVPGGVSWVVCSVVATLVTSATAANRTPSLLIGDGNINVGRFPTAGTQAASLTNRHGWARGAVGAASVAGAVDFGSTITAAPLPPNTQLSVTTANIQAADQWSLIGLYVIQIRERTMQELARYADDLINGVHDELFPGFPLGL